MLAYRLDTETAVVLVSAVDGNVAGGPIGDGMVVTVEHMQKVSQDEACQLKVSMGAEWKSIAVGAAVLVGRNGSEAEASAVGADVAAAAKT